MLSLDTLKDGQVVSALVTDVPKNEALVGKLSCPVQAQISPFVRSQLLFSDLFDPNMLLKSSMSFGSLVCKTFKVGQRVQLQHVNGKFRSHGLPNRSSYEKGDLVIVRFVKSVKGFGVTVQLDEKTFGTIELCEITDDITSNVAVEC